MALERAPLMYSLDGNEITCACKNLQGVLAIFFSQNGEITLMSATRLVGKPIVVHS
jgi:hypothetical protein